MAYRQVSLEKGSIWQLLAERNLPETISAWTLLSSVAKAFKGGVPPEGWQGVIFAVLPPQENVVVNLQALYNSEEFRAALEREKGTIDGYFDGAGRYAGSQCEVVLEINRLDSADVYALGGYSSDRDTLIRMMFGQDPTPETIAWFDQHSRMTGVGPGPMWLEGQPLQNVLEGMKPHIERLKEIKA